MKRSFGDKVKHKLTFQYKEELLEELKNNSIVLSFAISIIIIGIFSIFYNNSNSLLIGIAISSLLLTLIQCFSNGNTMLNILPVFTLLIFGFFEKSLEQIPIINLLLNKDYTDFIIFLAFSLTFLTQAYKNIIFKHNLKVASLKFNDEKNNMIYAELDIIKNIKDTVLKIKKLSEDKNYNDREYKDSIIKLLNYVEDETFISNVKSTLITKGSEDKKVEFRVEEIEESIMLNKGLTRGRNININKNNDEI